MNLGMFSLGIFFVSLSPEMKITVATVTYNASQTVERTLRSVAAQTYPDVEHLVVDGASKDGTQDICRRYSVRLVSEPDRGLYDAMNKALRLATGEYIVFLNAGDTLHDERVLERVAACAPADIIYGETDIVDADGRFLRHRRLAVPERLTWRSFLHGMTVCHQSFYVRTEVARSEEYDLRWRFSADFDWCIRCMKRATTLVRAEGILTDYLSEGMTTQNHRASLLERLRIMARHYTWPAALAMHLWFVVRAAR